MADQRPTVVAIDDEPVILKLIATHLELQGYRVLVAESGPQGLRLVDQERPALVLLDVAMPELDGFETLRRLRAFSHVPVIMLTAMDSYEDRVRGLELGADDYVVKPFSLGELAARIRALLRRSQHA